MRERLVEAMERWNNRAIERLDPHEPNPRPIDHEPWYGDVLAAHGAILEEWEAFEANGYQLPQIEELLGGDNQGNMCSWWRAGVLIARRKAASPLADLFPRTVDTLLGIPGMLSSMVSVLGPGGQIPPHVGWNSGSLNYLIGVVHPPGAGHEFEGVGYDLTDGDMVVFDDTKPHSAWNLSDQPRVVLMGDLLRPLDGFAGWRNTVVQAAHHHLHPDYSKALTTGAELHTSLNR